MKQFTSDVIQLWVKWSQEFHDQEIDKKEAEKQLQLLKSLIAALKKYPR